MDVELKALTKRFGQKQVLNDINLTFTEGRISCLMGASGVGKTTVVNLILGLLNPDSGEILGMKDKRVSAVFQEDRLIEHWNPIKNVRLVCANDVSEAGVIYELSKLGLSGDLNKPVKEFSGGMRRRVAIVRAILAKGDLIVFDEPFRGLDSILKIQVIDYIKKNTVNKTVIIITHESEDVELLNADLITLA